MRKEINKLYDPNFHIDIKTRHKACQHSMFVFNRARLVAREVDSESPNSIIACRMANRLHLVYVRVTFDDEQENGAGPLPGILIAKAKEMDAEPHVVRVHYKDAGTGRFINYFGHDELERVFKSGDHWRRRLIGKRKAKDYLALANGRLSKLELKVCCCKSKKLSQEEEYLDNILSSADTEEASKVQKNNYPGEVFLELRVDTFTSEFEKRPISITALTESSIDSDEFYIYTCTCGVPECANIEHGVEVVHEDGLVVWRDRDVKPKRIAVFDRKDYRNEILTKVRQALALYSDLGKGAYLGPGDRLEFVKAALNRAALDRND